MGNFGRFRLGRAVCAATVLLIVVAVAAHAVWVLLEPLLPSLLAICLLVLFGYFLLGRGR